MTRYTPAEVFPPGEFLREELEARGWTQEEFAEIIDRPAKVVNAIIAGKKRITPETAMDFAAALGTTAQLWMNLDSAYQLYLASTERAPRDERITREARLREKFPVRELIKRRWIEDSENFDVLEARVCEFYNIPSIDEEPRLSHAAKRNRKCEFSDIQLAWLFRVKHIASSFVTPRYSAKKLRESLTKLVNLTMEPEETRHIPHILYECGVRFVIVEPMPGSKIDGVCFWIDNNKTPVLGMTLRLNRIDNFWFVLRHEIEHILRGDGKDYPVVDVTGDDGRLTSDGDEEAEDAANTAAENFCVPRDDLFDFIDRVHPLYSEKKVLGFSRVMKRHPGIVLGQIHNKMGKYSLLRKYLVKIRDFVTQSAITDGYGISTPVQYQRS